MSRYKLIFNHDKRSQLTLSSRFNKTQLIDYLERIRSHSISGVYLDYTLCKTVSPTNVVSTLSDIFITLELLHGTDFLCTDSMRVIQRSSDYHSELPIRSFFVQSKSMTGDTVMDIAYFLTVKLDRLLDTLNILHDCDIFNWFTTYHALGLSSDEIDTLLMEALNIQLENMLQGTVDSVIS